MAYFIENHVVEEIQERADIVEVIGQYVELKKTGNNYRGLCPFHSEKTPSFTVSPDKKIYKCFGCGQGGSVINFVMNIESLSFPEACKILADSYGIQISTSNQAFKVAHDAKKDLYDINRQVALYFMENLKNDSRALAYLAKRDIDEKLIRRFGLGYARDSYTDLANFLKNQNIDLKKAEEAGVIKKNTKGSYYDFFRDRVIFPIINTKSRVIGFGARVIGDGQPKYLNTGETRIYHKKSNLYGLNLLKKNVDIPRIILVEGYMDVIGLASAGIHGAVASLGTAFTQDQARLIKKYTKTCYIVYDGDEAGKNASKRAVEIFHSVGLNPKVVGLPEQVDPEDYVKKYGQFQFKVKLREARDGYAYLVDRMSENLDKDSIQDKADLIRNIAYISKTIKSPIERDLYIQELSKEFNVSDQAIKQELNYRPRENKTVQKTKDTKKQVTYNLTDRALIDIIRLIIRNPEDYHYVSRKIDPKKIINSSLKETYMSLARIIESSSVDQVQIRDLLQYLRKNYIIDDGLYLEFTNNIEEFENLDSKDLLDELVQRVNYIDTQHRRNNILKRIQELENKEDKSQEEIEEIRKLLNEMMDL